MPSLLPHIDPDGLLEYSVVFTDRSLNSMSVSFQTVMTDVSALLKDAYNAAAVAVTPGGGTFGMESIARQFANDQHVMIIRNGWFSYRWSEILEKGKIASSTTVMVARREDAGGRNQMAPFAPVPVEEVGGIFVLDCVASGALWVDMPMLGVDVLLSAPQKGWSASPCAGLVMLSERGRAAVAETESSSYVCDVKKWLAIMKTYENGGHAYHATMPTDALKLFRDTLIETKNYGFEAVRQEQIQLGALIRGLLEERGFTSVAADGFKAASVVVSFTDDEELKNGSKFAAAGLQIAAGVPLQCGEGPDYKSFRIGLFGLDKLHDIPRLVEIFATALDRVIAN